MDNKSLKYLMISRYATYFFVFITSILLMDTNLTSKVSFSILFLILLVNSSIRSSKLWDKINWFVISIFLEIPLIMFMDVKYATLSAVALYIIVVDVYLLLSGKAAICMHFIVVVAMAFCSIYGSGEFNAKMIFMNFTANGVASSFFAASTYLIRRELEIREKMKLLYEELEISRDELKEANEKLTEYSEQIEEIAVVNERNRLAGEIHDNIGHSLTALIMELDICGKLIDKDTAKTKEELGKASQLARHTLSEVRRSVKAIMNSNNNEITGIKAIEELIEEYKSSTKIQVEFQVSTIKYKISPTVEVTLYRIIQEALTNCAKHGQANEIKIKLEFKEDKLWLDIKDNGQGCDDMDKGIGLRTMEERVTSLGGSISFINSNGFHINAIIPVEVRL